MKRNKKGFTLIELIAVLVILAILALIVTPLVMNIVKKAKDSANKRSVDAYGKAVELAVATHLLDNGDYPAEINSLTIEYSGNEVVCNVKTVNEDGSIYLSECSVKGTEVKDSSTEDGWYHYGKYAADVEAPGFSQEYKIGDLITYNGMDFYVIEDSDETSDRVTLLKAEPLTVDEVNKYGGVGTDNNHVNMYIRPYNSTDSGYQTAYDRNGYGGIAYYSSETCGYAEDGSYSFSGCSTDYETSDIKYVVDNWSGDKLNSLDLVEDNLGYKSRMVTIDDLQDNLGYDLSVDTIPSLAGETPEWLYSNSYYSYWTMSQCEDSSFIVWGIGDSGSLGHGRMDYRNGGGSFNLIRPVVTILKSAI